MERTKVKDIAVKMTSYCYEVAVGLEFGGSKSWRGIGFQPVDSLAAITTGPTG